MPALLAHLLLSSATFLVAKYALGHMSVLPLALLRFTLASATLGVIWTWRGGRVSRFERRDWVSLFTIGALAVPMNQGFFLWGLSHSSPAHAALFYATTPVFVWLFSLVRGEERASWARAVGLLLALLGVAVILLARGLTMERITLFGDLSLLAAVISWALYSVEARSLMQRHDALTVTSWSLISGTLLALPSLPWAWHAITAVHYIPGVWWSILFLAWGTSVVTYLLWIWCLSHSEASRVAVFTNLQPVVTTLFSVWLFREAVEFPFVVGASMVLGGVMWVQRTR